MPGETTTDNLPCASLSGIGPTDVNMNGVIARSQSLTFDALGKAFVRGESRLQLAADVKFDEISTVEAIAARYAQTGNPSGNAP